MNFGSVCSGIEAASQAWHPLGWNSVFNSEIEAFPRAVLKHHYPDVPLHGDFTTIEENTYEPIRLLVGGTPCQSFSVAGLRGGMDDDRGNLALEFLKLAQRTRPTWLVWENVPGVLSSSGGRDFGSLLGGLGELGYGFAYRVLDAQYFGVPQRRRRVFVVGYLGDWRPAAAVLFERSSLCGHPPPSRETRQDVAGTAKASIDRRRGAGVDPELTVCSALDASYGRLQGASGQDLNHGHSRLVAQPFETANCLTRRMHKGINSSVDEGQTPVIHIDGGETARPLKAEHDGMRTADGKGYDVIAFSACDNGRDAQDNKAPTLRSGNGERLGGGQQAAVAFKPGNSAQARSMGEADEVAPTVQGDKADAVAFAQNTRDEVREMPYAGALAAEPGAKQQSYIRNNMQVRRLTVKECERLQGFPDNYTQIEWRGKELEDCPDGPRYKALGNSMAVPVMRWIGERIQMVEELTNEE